MLLLCAPLQQPFTKLAFNTTINGFVWFFLTEILIVYIMLHFSQKKNFFFSLTWSVTQVFLFGHLPTKIIVVIIEIMKESPAGSRKHPHCL